MEFHCVIYYRKGNLRHNCNNNFNYTRKYFFKYIFICPTMNDSATKLFSTAIIKTN